MIQQIIVNNVSLPVRRLIFGAPAAVSSDPPYLVTSKTTHQHQRSVIKVVYFVSVSVVTKVKTKEYITKLFIIMKK